MSIGARSRLPARPGAAPAVRAACRGLTSFGGRKPRAVVATLGPAQALMELQAEHERLMQRVGLEPEGRKFTPHVTLARLRDSSSRQVADYLALRGAVPLAAVPGVALRAVFLARLGRRRALRGRGGLSAGGMPRGCQRRVLRGRRLTSVTSIPSAHPSLRESMAISIAAQYAASLAAGKIERDPAQEARRRQARRGWKSGWPSIGWRANRPRSAGCSARASASRRRSRASTSTARSAAARPC